MQLHFYLVLSRTQIVTWMLSIKEKQLGYISDFFWYKAGFLWVFLFFIFFFYPNCYLAGDVVDSKTESHVLGCLLLAEHLEWFPTERALVSDAYWNIKQVLSTLQNYEVQSMKCC